MGGNTKRTHKTYASFCRTLISCRVRMFYSRNVTEFFWTVENEDDNAHPSGSGTQTPLDTVAVTMEGKQHLEPSSSQPPRRRRPHKRSRNGCSTCKQRHVRCDQTKPVCTNCLVRGSDCAYAESGLRDTPSPAPSSSGSSHLTYRPPSPWMASSRSVSPAPPVPSGASVLEAYDNLPVHMPFRSMEVFQHFMRYRAITQNIIPNRARQADTTTSTTDLGYPLQVHHIILFASMHLAWLCRSDKPVEETYLHHKIETLRLLSQCINSTADGSFDICINTMTVLALTETGMGDTEAGAAHVRGLLGASQSRGVAAGGGRQYGLLQRLTLVIGAFITAAHRAAEQTGYGGPRMRSNPSLTPDLDHHARTSPVAPLDGFAMPATPLFFTAAAAADPYYHQVHHSPAEQQLIPIYHFDASPWDSPLSSYSPISTSTTASMPGPTTTSSRAGSPLEPAIPPHAYATAAYLLLHVLLEFKSTPLQPAEPALLRWLLESPRHLARPGGDNRDFLHDWLWKTVLGAYALVVGSAFPSATSSPPSHPYPHAASAGTGVGSGAIAENKRWFDALSARCNTQATATAGGPGNNGGGGGGLGFAQWDVARAVLDRVNWLVDGDAGRTLLRELWAEAVRLEMQTRNREVSYEERVTAEREALVLLALPSEEAGRRRPSY